MTPDQLKDEIKNVVKLFDEVYSVFGLHYEIELSTMPEDHIGTVEQWEHNQDILKEAITEMGKTYVINEGDGAFTAPSWTSTWPTPWAAPGSAAPFSWTLSCPSALSWSMWRGQRKAPPRL